MPDPAREPSAAPLDPSAPTRIVGVVAAVVIAVAFIGFVTGTQPDRYVAVEAPPAQGGPTQKSVPPARSHAELALRPWDGPAPAMAIESGARASRERAGTVAYAGAPPTIPHPVRASSVAECLGCHANGLLLGSAAANPIPHRVFASCTQCHISGVPAIGEVPSEGPAAVPSAFEGFIASRRGTRAHPTAPPAVPHPTFMRERCEACHGPLGRAALETPHPDRRSCTQCHVAPSARPPAVAGEP